MPGATTPERRQRRRWHLYPSLDDLEARAVAAVTRAAAQAIAARGSFAIVLAGGATPRRVYGALAGAGADWSRWRVYFGDERCLPPGDPGRNDAMAREAWLDRVPIPRAQLHFIAAERGPEDGATRYARVLAGVDRFDLVLLGVGEDGHTASLFPGHDLGDSPQAPHVLPVRTAPKPPAERVSVSASRLGRARQVLFLVSGVAKAQAVKAWAGDAALPAAAIVPPDGVDILIDPDAWPWKPP